MQNKTWCEHYLANAAITQKIKEFLIPNQNNNLEYGSSESKLSLQILCVMCMHGKGIQLADWIIQNFSVLNENKLNKLQLWLLIH